MALVLCVDPKPVIPILLIRHRDGDSERRLTVQSQLRVELLAMRRKSPDGDAVTYAMSALGTRCGKLVSVTPLKTPLLYEVICSQEDDSPHMQFTKYRLNTAAGIAAVLK